LDEPTLSSSLAQFPLLVSGPAVRIALAGAQPLAHLVPPLGGEQTIEHHTASLFNPPGGASSDAAIIEHTFGRGRAMYVSVAIGEYLRARRNVDAWAKQLVAQLVRRLLREPLVQTDAPAGVELVLNRATDGRLLLHLLNLYVASEHIDTQAVPRLADIHLQLNEARLGSIGSASTAPPLQRVRISRERPGWASITVPSLAIHQVVVVTPTQNGTTDT
jgi:hypothetical protein